MKKLFKLKNNIIIESLTEDTTLHLADEKLRNRARDLARLAKKSRFAAAQAEQKQKFDLRDKLNKQADEIEETIRGIYQDSLEDPVIAEQPNIGGEETDQEKNSQKSPKKPPKPELPKPTDEPQNPDKPGDLTDKPGEQKEPNGPPEKPSKFPKNPEEPEKPDEPGNPPIKPPEEPEEPTEPGDPPVEPDKPPIKPPEEPEEPTEPGDPPEKPEEPEKPEDDPVKNPFKDEEDIPQLPLGGGGEKEPRDPDLDDIIKMLKQLKGKAKDGATDGIKNLLKNKMANESLTEAVRNIRKMDDDEFGDYVNELTNLIKEVEDLEEITDIDDRIDKINKMKNDPFLPKVLKAEDNVEIRKDFAAQKAREEEGAKYSNYPTIKQFEIDFYETIKAQVDKVKQTVQSYDEINNEYESENIIMKADVEKELPEEIIPIIDFYFDCSGSWTKHPDAIEIGKRAVATVQEFEDRGEIKLNKYYFGRNDLRNNMSDVWGGGTKCWNQIIQNIKATNATNVVLMTDCDMCKQAKAGPTCVLDGCVWFIWSLYDYTRGSKQIVNHLKGIEGQGQFAFGNGGDADPSDYGDD